MKKKPDDCLKEPHELSHAPDALRYFAIAWTQPAQKTQAPKQSFLPVALQTDDDIEFDDNQMIDW
jgi:hypothetical protein